jgi:hypothetical protein
MKGSQPTAVGAFGEDLARFRLVSVVNRGDRDARGRFLKCKMVLERVHQTKTDGSPNPEYKEAPYGVGLRMMSCKIPTRGG